MPAAAVGVLLAHQPLRAAEPRERSLNLAAVDDPLPARAPGEFNPDPGGGRNPGSVPADALPPEPTPAPTSLFEGPPLPVPKAPPVGGGSGANNPAVPPIRRDSRLPRPGLPAQGPDLVLRLGYPQYQFAAGNTGALPNVIPQVNRWQIPFGTVQRYEDRSVETPYATGIKMFDPYKASLLKGDAPILGQDIFLNLQINDQYFTEFRRIPVGSGVSAARPNSNEFFGRSESYTINNDLSFTIELFKGETAFKPIDWAIHLTPVFNINRSEFKETGILNPDPRGPNYDGNDNRLPQAISVGLPGGTILNPGDVNNFFNSGNSGLRPARSDDFSRTRYTQRDRTFFSLQEAFAEVHIKDLSENYDFVSARFGSQLFNADFRGFLFLDTNTGLRLFGNYDNNRIQYNFAWFNMREKDTYSGLNRVDARAQDVLIFNVYRQDFLRLFLPEADPRALGYTLQLSLAANLDHGGLHYDRNDNITRPAPIGYPIKEHEVNAFYFGWNGDGHIGKYNITHSFYQALGRDDANGIAGRSVAINAQMFALEVSQDRDYLRPKLSFLYASGDGNAKDGKAHGFDSILDNPTFIGSPFSFYSRQGFGLANTALSVKQPNSLLLDLRTSKTEGQANFVNPGTLLFGAGMDVEVTPKLKAQFNANYIRFVDTSSVQQALFTNKAARDLGYDISLGFTYRPTLTNNIIINAGFGAFLPGHGYRDIFRSLTRPVPGFTNTPAGEVDSFLYSGLIAVTLTY